MTMRKGRFARGAAALVAAAAAAAVLAPAGTAQAASLPGASKTREVPGGSVSIRLFDHHVAVQTPVTHMPTSREVLLSGKVKVTTGGDLEGGVVSAGYLVGCQLSITAGAISGAGVTTNADDQWVVNVPDGNGGTTPVPTVLDTAATESASTVSIAPGVAAFVPVIAAKVGTKAVTGFTFTEHTGGLVYSQERFGVDGCAGFAQARPVVNVQVATDDFKGNISLLGKPFSIG